MKKLTSLLAASLIACAGFAHAGVQTLVQDTGVHLFDATHNATNDKAVTYAVGAQSGGVLVDFTFSYTGTLQNNDFLGFWFGTPTAASPNFGLKANCGTGGCANDLFLRMSGTDGIFLKNSDLAAGTDYHLMAYLHKTGNSTTYNAFDLWLNPTADETSTLSGADLSIAGASIAAFNTVGLRTSGIDNGVAVTLDEVGVSAVPEPASLSLIGLAAAGMVGLRRRRA